MARFIDFDAARAERQREPVTVRLFGRDWTLYTGLPASVMLDVIEAKAKGMQEVTDEQAVAMLRQLVPAEVMAEWSTLGLTVDELMELVPLLMRAYAGPGEDDAAGEALAPSSTQALSSVSAGGSSRRTASGSTGSTSTLPSRTA